MGVIRQSLFGLVVATMPMAAFAGDQIVVEIGEIRINRPTGFGDFVVLDTFAGSDTSWGGMNDADRNFRIFGQRDDGAELWLSVTYKENGVPSIWVLLERADGAVLTGEASEGMKVRIKRYDVKSMIPGQGLAVVAGAFSGPLKPENGAGIEVSGKFQVEMPRIAFSIAPPISD